MRLTSPFMIRKVQGHSMLPVLPPGTLIWGLCWFWRLRSEKVVIAEHNGREIVKRIDEIRPEGIFLIGDHPEASTDSRHYGVLPREAVKAIVVWPRVHRVLAQSKEVTIRQKDSAA
jgi:hypothetical protein